MHHRLGLLLLLLACGGNRQPAVPTNPASLGSGAPIATAIAPITPVAVPPSPPAGFATADLIISDAGELATYAIADGKIQQTSTVTLVKLDDEHPFGGVGDGDWADRDNLFVRVAARKVVHVTATTVTPVTIPDAARFKVPKPNVPEDQATDLTEGGVGPMPGPLGDNHLGLVVTRSEAWWSECPWGYPFDGFQCALHVNARLWPTTTLSVEPGGITPAEFSHPPRVAVVGYKAAIDPKSQNKSLVCVAAKGKKTVIDAGGDADQIDSAEWISASPPRLLVIYGSLGLGSVIPDRWTLHDGCGSEPLATGGTITYGPAGLWLSTDTVDGETTHRILRRGSAVVGELPLNGDVWFRPLAK